MHVISGDPLPFHKLTSCISKRTHLSCIKWVQLIFWMDSGLADNNKLDGGNNSALIYTFP